MIQGCYMCDSRMLYVLNRSPGRDKRGLPAGRRLLNKHICYKTSVLLFVLSPLQFGDRDLGFSYLGSGMRTDKNTWSGLINKLKLQSDDPNVLNATGDDRPDETTYLRIATLPPGGNRSGTRVRADRPNKGPGNCWCRCCRTCPRAASSTRPPEWCQTETIQFWADNSFG